MHKNCFLFLMILLIQACSHAPQEEKKPMLTTDYFIRYLESEQQFKAQASFSEGDSPQTARSLDMTEVAFQGEPMEKRELPGYGARYETTFNDRYGAGLFRFTYRSAKGRSQETRIQMTRITGFTITGPVSKSRGMKITVGGGLLGPYEELVLLFTDAKHRASSLTLRGPAGDSAFTLLPEQLSALTPGPGQLYLVKKRTEINERPNRTTISAVEYYTGVMNVVVE